MDFHARRTQWAVGQGFMHSGVLGEPDGPARLIVWLYDCGTVSGNTALSRELGILRERHGRHIDMLYISHFHEDHVNGLSDLRQSFTVDRVFMPLLDSWERLLAFGSWREDPPAWYSEFIAGPATWMGQWAESVFQVVPEPVDPLPPAPIDEFVSEDEGEGDLQPPGSGGGVVTARNAAVAYGTPSRPVWVWEPYVLDAVSALRDRF